MRRFRRCSSFTVNIYSHVLPGAQKQVALRLERIFRTAQGGMPDAPALFRLPFSYISVTGGPLCAAWLRFPAWEPLSLLSFLVGGAGLEPTTS